MTRECFDNEVDDWYYLKNFCDDHGCDICDEIGSHEYMEETIIENIDVIIRYVGGDLLRLRDYLQNLPLDADYVICGEYPCEWGSVDWYDLQEYKQFVIRWGDENGIWDEEDEEYVEECTDSEFDDMDEDTGGCPIEDLLQCGFMKMKVISGNCELVEREIEPIHINN